MSNVKYYIVVILSLKVRFVAWVGVIVVSGSVGGFDGISVGDVSVNVVGICIGIGVWISDGVDWSTLFEMSSMASFMR